VIRHEAQKKSRHLPIRDLLAKTEDLVQELKPCFMMSPLSVSQFLPGSFSFDVVIFDEASQVLPSDAVNCIYRARQVIVAGDEKQLPPTAFFTQAIDESEEDEGLDDFESVLKLCKTSFASLPLTWHYRSQHENLIAYSNYKFYSPDDSALQMGGALQTFPGARFDAPDLGVESFVVNGVYRRGSTRDNPVEAEAVVDRVLHHRRQHPDLSIGVVTFSSAQEDTITAAIDRRSVNEPLLRGLLEKHDRLTGFFVKNLENVQGDERDIIIFSVGYGPDEDGKFTMSFGPLNSKGGWRRLNVAITRARMRVEVVSSFRAGEMHDTTSEGVRHLRGYLDFAQRGLPALALELEPSGMDVESPFEADVLEVIRGWGYEVVPQVGTAGYRIDLGVRHPDRPGEYILGVECDGAAYHSAKAARDRDRLRAAVLEGLGWHLHRIWGLSWYRDRVGQINRLRLAIEHASAGVKTKDVAAHTAAVPVEMEEIDLDQPPEWAVTYGEYGGAAPYTPYELGSVEAREPLRSYLIALLRHEAPVHRDLVNRRIRNAFGVGRIGQVIRDNIDFVANRSHVDGNRISVDPQGFYRLEKVAATSVRVPEDEDSIRAVQHVPNDELDLAVIGTVMDAISVGEAEVVIAVRRMFGWRRSGGDIVAAVQASIERCLSGGTIEQTSSGSLRIASS
jgi:very-short-patch-repair endonuclease